MCCVINSVVVYGCSHFTLVLCLVALVCICSRYGGFGCGLISCWWFLVGCV